MPGSPAGDERELVRDHVVAAARIAAIVRCAPHSVCTWRHYLEAAGVIEAVPVSQCVARPRRTPFRTRSLAAIERGATLSEHLMAQGISYSASYVALAKARARRPPTVTKTTTVRTIGLACCTATWRNGRWQHDRACPER